MAKDQCERCDKKINTAYWCPKCRYWLCKFCVTWGKKCPQCGSEVNG
jgi:hypothetical protein